MRGTRLQKDLQARAVGKTAAPAPVCGPRPAAVFHDHENRIDGQDFLPVFLCGIFPYPIVGKYLPPHTTRGGIRRTPCKSSEKRANSALIQKLYVFELSHILEGVRSYLRARGILSPNWPHGRLPIPFRPIPRSRTIQIKARNYRALTTTMHSRFDPLFSACSSRPGMYGNLPLQTAPPTSQMGRIIRSLPIRFN